MDSTSGYWKDVLLRSGRDAWDLVVGQLPLTVVAAVLVFVAQYYIRKRWYGVEAVSGTWKEAVAGTVAVLGVGSIVFFVHVFFVTPRRLVLEAKATAATAASERESALQRLAEKRPYFSQEDAGLQYIRDEHNKITGMYAGHKVKNVGQNPATDIEGFVALVAMPEAGKYKELRREPISYVNDVGSGGLFQSATAPNLPSDSPPVAFVWHLEYRDPLTELRYSQDWFLKFSGVKDGQFLLTFFSVSAEDKKALVALLGLSMNAR